MSAPSVIVGLSGGVDSSVAAWMLLRAGYRVEGLFMKNWEDDDEDGLCAAAEDLAHARRVCEVLGIPLHRASFAREYRERVFRHFLSEYAAGRTPNPDVLCNREIKFGAFLRHARRLGADWVATGHYARIEHGRRGLWLLKGCDPAKDQSYFLHAVSARQLERVLFPVGALAKDEVRALARAAGLPTHDRPDSTGICFIGERPFREFLARYLPARPGEIRALDGRVLGEHRGVAYYTIGQRAGLGIGGRADAGEGAWYVVDKDPRTNVLYVAQGHEHPRLMARAVLASGASWVAGAPPPLPWRGHARIRHRHREAPCRVEDLGGGRLRVAFDEPQRAPAPGQYVVLYDGERCLGGAVIDACETLG